MAYISNKATKTNEERCLVPKGEVSMMKPKKDSMGKEVLNEI